MSIPTVLTSRQLLVERGEGLLLQTEYFTSEIISDDLRFMLDRISDQMLHSSSGRERALVSLQQEFGQDLGAFFTRNGDPVNTPEILPAHEVQFALKELLKEAGSRAEQSHDIWQDAFAFQITHSVTFPVRASPIRGISLADFIAKGKLGAAGAVLGLMAYATDPSLFLYVGGGILLLNVVVPAGDRIAEAISSTPGVVSKDRLRTAEQQPQKRLPKGY